MNTRIFTAAATAAFLCAGGTFAQAEPVQDGAAKAQAGQHQAEKEKMPLTAEKLLNKLHHNNLKEIKMGELAQERGQSDAVKQYGQRLVQDHQQADQKVQELAKAQNVELKEMQKHAEGEHASKSENATKTSEAAQAAKDGAGKEKLEKDKQAHADLMSKSGEEFDQAFAQMMVKDHQKALDLVDRGLKQQDLESIHPLLNEMRPKLEQHRESAEQLAQQSGGTATGNTQSN